MPKLPQYESRVQLQPVQYPNIPAGAASDTAEGVAKLGQAIYAQGADIDTRLSDLKRLEEFTRNSTDAEIKLMELGQQLSTDNDFFSDPEGAPERFKAKAAEVKNWYASQIQDPTVRLKVGAQIDRKAADLQLTLLQAGRKQRISSAQGTLASVLAAQERLAGAAKDESELLTTMGKTGVMIDAYAARGAISPEEAAKAKLKAESAAVQNYARRMLYDQPDELNRRLAEGSGIFSRMDPTDKNTLLQLSQERANHLVTQAAVREDKAQKEAEKEEVNATYAEVDRLFPGDFAAQRRAIQSPNFHPGISVEKRNSLLSLVDSNESFTRTQRNEAQKKVNEAEFDAYLKAPKSDAEIKAGNASPELKQSLINLNRQQRDEFFKPNAGRRAEVKRRIWSGEIASKYQLAAEMEKGGLGTDLGDLEATLEQAQDPVKSGYFRQASELFDAMYKNDDDMKAMKPDFLNLLDHEIKKRSQGGRPVDIYGLAKELLTPMEEKVFFGLFSTTGDPPFKRAVEDRWAPKQGNDFDRMQEDFFSTSPAKPIGKNSVRTPIPRNNDQDINIRDRAIKILQDNRKAVTEESIRRVYDQIAPHIGAGNNPDFQIRR